MAARTLQDGAPTGMPYRIPELTRRPGGLPAGVQAADKGELFARFDVVVLCCPLTEQTRGLVDADTVAGMKRDAILVNVARGPVVASATPACAP
jgi:D-3-phosphoglycerate dehydrogenase / 2-oxoglutarate reductase